MASAKVFISVRSVANCFFAGDKSVRLVLMTPLLSTMTMFSFLMPNPMYNFVQELAAAPAPLTTSFASSIFFPCMSRAFKSPAPEIIAVPC